MSLALHWFLPTTGDARGPVGGGHDVPLRAGGTRPPTIDYLAQVARTAEGLGFEGLLTPTGTWCEDAWLVTAALLRETERLRFLVAFRPGVTSPTLSAQMAATFQRISGGRLILNVVTGGDPKEQARFGDHLSHDLRYARTDEFLEVVRGAWSDTPFSLSGDHYQVEGATVRGAVSPAPPIYFGGSSPAAGPVAARHADVYLTWGEPPEQVAEKIAWIRSLAAGRGRTVRFGMRVHTLSRDTSEQAWAEAQRILDAIDPAWIEEAQRILDAIDPAWIEEAQRALAASESVGQARMRALHGGRTEFISAHDLEVHPGLWSGIGLVRGGAGTSLVGSHQEVADLIADYHALGIDELILSGYPHVEEAYWFAEGVRPLLAERGLLRDDAGAASHSEPVGAA